MLEKPLINKEDKCQTKKLNKGNGTKGKDVKKLRNGKESRNGKEDDSWIVSACSICDSPLEEDAGDVTGNFGIIPIGFCVWCLSSVKDMVIKMQGYDDIDVLKEMIIGLGQEEGKN